MSVELFFQIVAVTVALGAAISAYRSYALAKEVRDEVLADDTIVFGMLRHPNLREQAHSDSVIYCYIFNRSRSRKAYVEGVVVEYQGHRVVVQWGEEMDRNGDILSADGLFGFRDSSSLCIRRDDGKSFMQGTTVLVKHSFENESLVFDPYDNPSWTDN